MNDKKCKQLRSVDVLMKKTRREDWIDAIYWIVVTLIAIGFLIVIFGVWMFL